MFNAPRTEFVARFIGGHNVIETANGPIAVRADRMILKPQATAAAVAASVQAVEYQGTHVHLTLATTAAMDLAAMISEQTFDAAPMKPGDSVFVSWGEADVHRLSAPS